MLIERILEYGLIKKKLLQLELECQDGLRITVFRLI